MLLFQLLASLAWTGGDWFVASITLLTHAGLSLVEQYAAFWTQRPTGAPPTLECYLAARPGALAPSAPALPTQGGPHIPQSSEFRV